MTNNFNTQLDKAAEIKVHINTELKMDEREIMDSFVSKMVSLNPELTLILNKKKKSRTEEEKEKLSNFISEQKKLFKIVKKSICPSIKADGSTVNPLAKMVSTISAVYQMLVYLGDTETMKIFNDAKLSIATNKLEVERPELDNDDVKKYLNYLFKETKTTNETIQTLNNEIKNDIFMELDEQIRQSEINKKGLKPAQFGAMAEQKAVSLTKSVEDYMKYKNRKLTNYEDNLASLNLTIEKSMEI